MSEEPIADIQSEIDAGHAAAAEWKKKHPPPPFSAETGGWVPRLPQLGDDVVVVEEDPVPA